MSEKNCEINSRSTLDMESSSSPLPSQNPEVLGSNPEEVMGSNPNHGGARPKQYSNVIVDDSPLQNQMEKNKECKSNFRYFLRKITTRHKSFDLQKF